MSEDAFTLFVRDWQERMTKKTGWGGMTLSMRKTFELKFVNYFSQLFNVPEGAVVAVLKANREKYYRLIPVAVARQIEATEAWLLQEWDKIKEKYEFAEGILIDANAHEDTDTNIEFYRHLILKSKRGNYYVNLNIHKKTTPPKTITLQLIPKPSYPALYLTGVINGELKLLTITEDRMFLSDKGHIAMLIVADNYCPERIADVGCNAKVELAYMTRLVLQGRLLRQYYFPPSLFHVYARIAEEEVRADIQKVIHQKRGVPN